MSTDFSGQLALVTGGTRGIGAAIAAELASRGARVIATGRTASGAGPGGGDIRYEAVDFDDIDGTRDFAARMAELPLAVLVNNAGINKIALGGEVDMADWDRIQRVNVRAPMVLCRAIAPKMAERGYGRIVNITSIWGHISRSKRIWYSSSKFALLGLTKALALDYGPSNVLVNGVAPGFIDTELTRTVLPPEERERMAAATPVRRLGTEADIARVVAFFASSANTFVTGQNIIADGGFTSGG